MRSILALLAFAASALAYSVTEPTAASGWTTSGPNVVAWNRVDTDAANFTILLVNQKVTPATSQILDALVDGTLGKITVNPPSGGWKTGQGFQVNLVKDAQDLNTILAQSPVFGITTSTSSTFSTTISTTSSSGTLTVPAATTTGTSTDTAGSLNPTTSDTSTTPQKNGAPFLGVPTGLWVGTALLGAVFA